MFENIATFLQSYVLPLGPLGVFLASVAEEVIAPIPSALVMMTAGFLFVSGPVDVHNILKLILYVGLPAALGVTLGSLWIYGLSFWGGKQVLDRWGKWIGLYWSDVEKMQARLSQSRKDEMTIIGARIIPFVPSVAISAFCGFIRMKFWKYFILTFVGMFARAMVMGAIGWQVGNVYIKYVGQFANLESKLLLLIIAVVIVCLLFFLYKRSRNAKI